MRIIFIGGYANGEYVNVEEVEMTNVNDPEDFSLVYPAIVSIRKPLEDVKVRKLGEEPPTISSDYEEYKLNEIYSEDRLKAIRFYALRTMTQYEITAALLTCFATMKGRW